MRSSVLRVTLAVAALALAASPIPSAVAGVRVAGNHVEASVPFTSDNVDLVANFPVKRAIGATFQGNYMYVTGVEGLDIFDISSPELPVPLGHLPLPHFENEDVSVGGNTLLIAVGWLIDRQATSLIYVIDIANPLAPYVRNVLRPIRGSHTISCVPSSPNCRYAYLAGDSLGGVHTIDTTTPPGGNPDVAGWGFEVGGSHDVQFDSDGIAWVAGFAGTAGYDTTINPVNPPLVARTNAAGGTGPWNSFIHHNSERPDDPITGEPGNVLFITEEDYANTNCADAGWFEAWQINGALSTTSPAILSPIDYWTVAENPLSGNEAIRGDSPNCSSHYFTIADGIAANSWYTQGIRFLDVSNPADLRQVGYYVPPVGAMFAAYWAPTDPTASVVYGIDAARGVDVIVFDRDRPMTTVATPPAALAARPGVTLAPSAQWGWGCPLVAA